VAGQIGFVGVAGRTVEHVDDVVVLFKADTRKAKVRISVKVTSRFGFILPVVGAQRRWPARL
jgi:predicted ATP-dependent serine protease